jgi:hypothetical protein
VVIWRFTGARNQSEAAERRAQKLIAACFATLAAYLTFDGVRTLAISSHAETSRPGRTALIHIVPVLTRLRSLPAQPYVSGFSSRCSSLAAIRCER